MQEVSRSGFERPESLIHLFVGGSELHGAKVGATDDLDLYGVFLDPPSAVLGLNPRHHFVWSTASDARRNGPEDVDLTLYSLRRWAGLAAKGNATALHFLFADATAVSSELWKSVQSRRELFLSRHSAASFWVLLVISCGVSRGRRVKALKGIGRSMSVPLVTTPRRLCIVCGFTWNASISCDPEPSLYLDRSATSSSTFDPASGPWSALYVKQSGCESRPRRRHKRRDCRTRLM